MERDIPKHEKIRFRRREAAALHELPSAAKAPLTSGVGRVAHRSTVAVLKTLAVLAVLVIIGAGIIYPVAVVGIGTEQLRQRAEKTIAALTGENIRAEIGSTGLSVDRSLFVGFALEDVRAMRRATGEAVIDAGSITLGIKLLPLLTGDVVLGNARIADATFDLGVLPSEGARAWDEGLTNPDGLVDPGRAIDALFLGTSQAFALLDGCETTRFELENVRFLRGGGDDPVTIENASFAKSGDDALAISAEVLLGERVVRVDGTARRSAGLIRDLRLTLDIPGGEEGDADLTGLMLYGAVKASLEGRETGSERLLKATASFDGVTVRTRGGEEVNGSGSLRLSATNLEDTVEIGASHLAFGRSRVEFTGVAGTVGAERERGRGATYGMELVSRRSSLAPADSPEPALPAMGRLVVAYEPETLQLHVDTVEVYTGPGQAIGKARLDFSDPGSPGIMLALSVPSMPVAHAKQLWPVFSARGARRWVLANLFGGDLRDSALNIDIPAGKLRDGGPLAATQAFGRFNVSGTRFDVTGEIPPVRDAVGRVDFRGTDVFISLASGTAYLDGGRSVEAGPGTLTILDAHLKPVRAELELDVGGGADAIVELAGYKPINASRFVPYGPDSFTGSVNGHISAAFPLEAKVEANEIDWRVDLAYQGLDIDKPVAGQTVTEADGTVVIDPRMAVVAARAKLNGMAADLAIVEPFDGDEEARERKVDLTLDDAARKRQYPGLDGLVSGPLKVSVDSIAEGRQTIVADATRAVLNIPWVGWQKGAGIPATIRFTMGKDRGNTVLSGFELRGDSFGASGTVTLGKDSGFQGADFSRVALSRGDNLAVKIARSGSAFDVRINGKSYDARSLIKLYASTGGASASSAAERTRISLDASVERVGGFGDEALSEVRIGYAGNGTDPSSVSLTAKTRSGTALRMSDAPENGRRTVRLASTDAGSVLRFLDIYEHMVGGRLEMVLAGQGGNRLAGQVDVREFIIENEPRIASLVASTPAQNNPSMAQPARAGINARRARFDRGFALIEKGPGSLKLDRGILRGTEIGATFQGMLYDQNGRISLAGTFMPAYGLNRVFGEIPLIGQILGNGRDGGLIGITYKLTGEMKNPQLQVNPMSVIAPGIFRSIFEFR